jgi:chitinase
MLGTACDSPTDPWDGPPIFSEDFEAGLEQWTGRPPPRDHYAQIVDDPLRPGNSVVNFTRTVAAGDLFTLPIPVDVTKQYKLTFEYLGLPSEGSLPDNLGGFLGVGDGIPGDHYWLYGPVMNPATHESDLIDDGQWHSYEAIFIPSELIAAPDGEIRIMIEDGEGIGSLPEDACFDNIQLFEKGD